MNSRLLQVLAAALVIAALIAGYMGYQTTSAAQQALEAAKRSAAGSANSDGQAAVVVLSRPVERFATLTAADLVIDYLKVSPPGSFQSIQQVVGSTMQVALPAGTIVLPEHFNPGGQVARLLRAGERAVAIAVNDVVGGGGFVQPGDMVDILFFLEKQGQESPRGSAQVILKAVRVLSFGEDLIDVSPADKEDKEKDEQRERSAKTAVLAIPEADVTRLMLASTLGELRLVIVPTEEMRLAANPQAVEASPESAKLNAMLPKVDLVPNVTKSATAVPSQRFFLTDSALQTMSAQSSGKSSSASPRRVSAPTTVVAQQVIIIRGLSTEASKK